MKVLLYQGQFRYLILGPLCLCFVLTYVFHSYIQSLLSICLSDLFLKNV
jgi:hypothetical protein